METLDLGLLILRVVLGLSIAAHGAQKLFGWFGGYGIAGTGGWLESIGLKPGKPLAFLAGAGEFFGGLALVVGFLTPVAGIAVALVLVVSIVTVHKGKGFWNTNGGSELPLLIIASGVTLALTGAGAYSVDALLLP
jgi:putative oxidoreductase